MRGDGQERGCIETKVGLYCPTFFRYLIRLIATRATVSIRKVYGAVAETGASGFE